MSVLTDAEIEFLNSQRLGRLATVGADGLSDGGLPPVRPAWKQAVR